MSFASKNLKVFSSYSIPNDKKSVQPTPLKMRFLDKNTDGRAWSCSAFLSHDYLLDLMNLKENEGETLTSAKKTNSHVSFRDDEVEETDNELERNEYGCGDSSVSLSNSNIQLRDKSNYHAPDCSENFTFRFEEVPSVSKFYSCESCNEDEECIPTISMATNHGSAPSLKVDIKAPEFCPKCNGKILR